MSFHFRHFLLLLENIHLIPFCGFHSLLKFFIFSSTLSIFSSNFSKLWDIPTLMSLLTNFIIRSSCESAANFFPHEYWLHFPALSCVYQAVYCTLYGKQLQRYQVAFPTRRVAPFLHRGVGVIEADSFI